MFTLFGKKVRKLREEKGLTREVFCEDEVELSVRQLARIENGESIPSLAKVEYIARQLGVTVGFLTGGESFELPKRYQELKYAILRTPVYSDVAKIKQREQEYEEIAEHFYDQLPEEEKLIIDSLQSILDVSTSHNSEFGLGLLEDYFEQIKKKEIYTMNDLILIELYLVCVDASVEIGFYDEQFQNSLLGKLLKQKSDYDVDSLFILSRILIVLFSIYLRDASLTRSKELECILQEFSDIMVKIQDFQRMPILNLMEWKYRLHYQNNYAVAQKSYEKAVLFAQLQGDSYLEEQLQKEWQKDTT